MKIVIWVLNFITLILFEDVVTQFHLFNITDIGQLEGYRQMEGHENAEDMLFHQNISQVINALSNYSIELDVLEDMGLSRNFTRDLNETQIEDDNIKEKDSYQRFASVSSGISVPKLFEGSGCVDTRPWCEYIDIEVDCKASYVQKNCQKSCNLCSGSGACHDNWMLKRCTRLKLQGKCGKRNVAKNCQKTCDLCTDEECPKFCAEIYAPVCGTDGNTYENECELKVQACYTHNNDLKVEYDGECKVPTCIDGIQNQGEAGIDCGGPCRPCASCNDGIHNQDEDKIDCGGPCKACPTCNDGIQNQHEAGIDCGGPCRACPTCNDNIQNQGENGIDCGGPCTNACNLELCCFNGKLEQHPGNPWHGDVCRNWDLSFTVCPLGCHKSREPYCLRNGSPCRIEAGKECALSICPRSHPYLDLDGRAPKFHGQHGDVCRNRHSKFACPKGCRYHPYHYCVEEKYNYPCRT